MSALARPSERRRRGRLLLLLAALLLLALPVAAQDGGSRSMLTRLVESLLPGLRVEGLRGPLAARPGFTRLTLSDAQGVWLEIQDASLDWSPGALLGRRLHIEELVASRVTLHRLPAGSPDTATPPTAPGAALPAPPSLPVALQLDRLVLDRLELAPPVLGEAVALSARGGARLDAGGLDITLDALLIEGGATLAVSAVLRPAGDPLTLRAALRGEAGGALSRLAGLGPRPLALDLRLEGPAEGASLSLVAEAGPGVAARLAGTLAAPRTGEYALDVEGSADGSGLLDGPLASLAGPVQLRLDGTHRPDGLVELRRLRIAGTGGEVSAEGRLDTQGTRSDLRLHARLAESARFAALLPDPALGWDAITAEAEVTGALATPRILARLAPEALRGPDPLGALLGPRPEIALDAVAPDRIALLTLEGAALRLSAQGVAGDPLDLALAASLDAAPGLVPGVEGRLALAGTARGPRADPTLTLQADAPRLEVAGRVIEALGLSARIATPFSRPQVAAEGNGRLQGLPLSLALRGAPEAEGWLRLEQAEAALGPARLTAAGRLNAAARLADGEARLEAADLAPLSRLLGQPLAGALRFVARGTLDDGAQRIAARLDVPRLVVAGTEARGVIATAEGRLDALDLAFTGHTAEVEAELRAKLTQAEGAHRLDIATLRAAASGETVRLTAPARLTRRPDGAIEIGATNLALGRGGTLRAEGRWGPERADLRATLAALNLASFAALLPDLAPEGIVAGEARITGPTASPEIAANLRATGLRSGAARGLPAGEARVELRRQGDGALTARAQAQFGPQQRLEATARFPRGPGATLPFEGTLDGALDLGPLTAPVLAAGADRVTGRLNLALRARGTPEAPVLGGEARIANGSYRNAVLGIAITNLDGTLRPEGDRLRAAITGRTAGEGRIALGGTVAPLSPGMPVDLSLTAANAQPVASDLLRATLDAELRLAGQLSQSATLSGPIRVRRADIRLPENFGGSVPSLGRVIERGTPPGRAPRPPAATPAPRDPEAGLPILLALTVDAPRSVFVRGRGLEVELGGQLGIGGRLTAPEITGALDLRRGEFALAGRRLEVERGRLAWTGGLLPDLALRATSQSASVTARVDVTGPPTAPEITFSSTPELPQDEVLARLLFDRPLRELSPFEIAQIAAAVAGQALPGGGPTGIVDRLRQGLGLDRLAVGGENNNARQRTATEERNGPTVEAGRYVADGVYVGVRQGTEPGSSRVGVRVDLTPRLRLEAETGDREAGNRVGVSWEWQWGR
jgi:translocation and assembly module TamB